ncbi:MAG: HEAT repeat domain-containing protein, partial [Chloroflexota bacterium]|nr:HEAT repeat domain-containing protein [Chloroflexota bacterium]
MTARVHGGGSGGAGPAPVRGSRRSLDSLIAALDSDDPREQRSAGDELVRYGPNASTALAAALVSGPARARKAAAYLLGRLRPSEEGVIALRRAVVEDPEPKVRKNAAVSLGRLEDEDATGALARALEREQTGWVRSSLVLALGAIGGEAARQVLLAVEPQH